jgi:hypothetical protein
VVTAQTGRSSTKLKKCIQHLRRSTFSEASPVHMVLFSRPHSFLCQDPYNSVLNETVHICGLHSGPAPKGASCYGTTIKCDVEEVTFST